MKTLLWPALCLMLGIAHADTTIRVDVTSDPGSKMPRISTRPFEAGVGHTFTDPSRISAYLTGTLGEDQSWLDVSYSGAGWHYFATARDADGGNLPFTGLDRHVAAGGHILEHFRVSLSRAFLTSHISQGANITFSGKTDSIVVALPAMFIHDYLETSEKALANAAAQGTASVKLHFGAQYLPLEPAFAGILGLPGPRGLLVTMVQPSGVAAHSGLQQGDVILQLDEKPLNSVTDLEQALSTTSAGSTVTLKIWRAGSASTVSASF